MIDCNAVPVSHKPPYGPISVSHPGRKRVITLQQWVESGGGIDTREPDPSVYDYDINLNAWILKD